MRVGHGAPRMGKVTTIVVCVLRVAHLVGGVTGHAETIRQAGMDSGSVPNHVAACGVQGAQGHCDSNVELANHCRKNDGQRE